MNKQLESFFNNINSIDSKSFRNSFRDSIVKFRLAELCEYVLENDIEDQLLSFSNQIAKIDKSDSSYRYCEVERGVIVYEIANLSKIEAIHHLLDKLISHFFEIPEDSKLNL